MEAGMLRSAVKELKVLRYVVPAIAVPVVYGLAWQQTPA
jgi:hypothetical protein